MARIFISGDSEAFSRAVRLLDRRAIVCHSKERWIEVSSSDALDLADLLRSQGIEAEIRDDEVEDC